MGGDISKEQEKPSEPTPLEKLYERRPVVKHILHGIQGATIALCDLRREIEAIDLSFEAYDKNGTVIDLMMHTPPKDIEVLIYDLSSNSCIGYVLVLRLKGKLVDNCVSNYASSNRYRFTCSTPSADNSKEQKKTPPYGTLCEDVEPTPLEKLYERRPVVKHILQCIRGPAVALGVLSYELYAIGLSFEAYDKNGTVVRRDAHHRPKKIEVLIYDPHPDSCFGYKLLLRLKGELAEYGSFDGYHFT